MNQLHAVQKFMQHAINHIKVLYHTYVRHSLRHCSVEVMGSSNSQPEKEKESSIKDIIKRTYPSTDESTKKVILCQIEDQIKELAYQF